MAKGKTRRNSGKGKNAKQRCTRKTNRANGGGYEEIGLHTPRGIEEIDIGQSFTAYPNLKYGEDHRIQESDLPDKHFESERPVGENQDFTLVLSDKSGLRAHITEENIFVDDKEDKVVGSISERGCDFEVYNSYFSNYEGEVSSFVNVGNNKGGIHIETIEAESDSVQIPLSDVVKGEVYPAGTSLSNPPPFEDIEELFQYDAGKGDMVIYAPQASGIIVRTETL